MSCAFVNGHEYIGARYVPQIEGEWDINKEYENFSIVIDENNNSWTSKKNVPAGIVLTDTEYWVQTGNFEGAVQGALELINNRITSTETAVDGLNTLVLEQDKLVKNNDSDIELLKIDVKDISVKNDKQELDIVELQSKVEELSKGNQPVNYTSKDINVKQLRLTFPLATDGLYVCHVGVIVDDVKALSKKIHFLISKDSITLSEPTTLIGINPSSITIEPLVYDPIRKELLITGGNDSICQLSLSGSLEKIM